LKRNGTKKSDRDFWVHLENRFFSFSSLSLSFPFLFLLSPVILSFSFETDRGGAEKTHKEPFWNDCQKCWLQARTYWKSVQFSMRIVFTNACRWTQSDIWEASLGFLIRNSFFKNRRFHTAIYLKIVYTGQSILKLNPDGETIMCLIQCIDCPSCIGLSLVPLKDDYFKGRKPKCFWFWPRKDLVRRFKNSGNFHTVVYDHICKNPGCPRKDPNYQPAHSSKRDSTCGSVYCQLETCRLVVSSFEDYCKNHHPRPDLLDKQAPQFRIRLARGDGFEVDDFVFMFFNKKRKWK